MLTLARRIGEAVSLVVNCPDGTQVNIAVILMEVHPGFVRVGFQAPKCVSIERDEIAEPTDALRDAHAAFARKWM